MARPLPKAPDAGAVKELLLERHPLDGLTLELSPVGGRPHLIAKIERKGRPPQPRQRVTLELTHVSGGSDPATWDLVMDALDALIGTLVESGYAYRDLPSGDDVSYEGAILKVAVECTRPDLEERADQLLDRN